MRKNLVIAAVGDESVHPTWLSDARARSFDLALIYFGDTPDKYREQAEHYFPRKGIKFLMIHELAQRELADVLPRYDYVWLPDDDIAGDTAAVNRLFAIAAERRLAICQPGIGAGDVSFRSLRADPRYLLRYSPFVEIMCPLFSRAALARVLPTFNANVSAWGIDWLWASMFHSRELAVIDAAPMAHTRPLQTGGVHGRLAKLGVNPGQEHRDLLRVHGLNVHRQHKQALRNTGRLRGVRVDGQEVWTRSWLATLLRRKAA